MDLKVAVLIPCYNEELTIKKVVSDFREQLKDADIYVYNNNSSDRTSKFAKEAGAIVINEYKQGKGNVVRSMFRDVEADIYVLVDGDDTYPAAEVHKLIAAVTEKKADMAVGDRISNGTYRLENKRNFHKFGNDLVRATVNFIFRTKLKDIMSGYRVFNRDFVKNFPALSCGFEIETEMTFHALDKNYKIVELPIVYVDRKEGSQSKVNTLSDGIKVLFTIFNAFKNSKPLAFFSIIALILFGVALFIGVPLFVEYFKTGLVTRFQRGIVATGITICSVIFFASGVILDTLCRHHKENLEILRNINKEKERN